MSFYASGFTRFLFVAHGTFHNRICFHICKRRFTYQAFFFHRTLLSPMLTFSPLLYRTSRKKSLTVLGMFIKSRQLFLLLSSLHLSFEVQYLLHRIGQIAEGSVRKRPHDNLVCVSPVCPVIRPYPVHTERNCPILVLPVISHFAKRRILTSHGQFILMFPAVVRRTQGNKPS